jgi:hypothetical protein
MHSTTEYDLQKLISDIVKIEDGIDEIYLFGSRAYNTESVRSDCDLLVRVSPTKNTKASNLRNFAMANCSALDFFIGDGARATSCANDSYVFSNSFADLVVKLDAIQLWTRSEGFTGFVFGNTRDWTFQVSSLVAHPPTALPNAHVDEAALQHKIKTVELEGFPPNPYIGDTLSKCVSKITDILRKMVFRPEDLGQNGGAKAGWTVALKDEYDCQNLFFTVVKPWLSELGREEIAIQYDGQSKRSDFSLFEGQLIIEMKFIDSKHKKREVVKTLDGLSRFYSKNGNVGCVVMAIFVKESITLDDVKWEADYSFTSKSPQVLTVVVRVP